MPDAQFAVTLRQEAPIPLDVSFSCEAGDVLAIFGPSGSGKTTILRSIAGLYQPQHAEIIAGGRVWSDARTGLRLAAHQRRVGYVFQDYALFPHMTALGNVMAALGHRARRERRPRAEALLAQVHLSALAHRRPHALSGGERQRVALARALAREPAVLLLDEPFAAVDRSIRRHLQQEIQDVRQSLATPLVLVTHDFDDVVRLATHVLLLDRGKTVASGRLETVMGRPDMPWLREAVGLGSVLDARVAMRDAARGLLSIDVAGIHLLVAQRDLEEGTRVRLRIPAREVILAEQVPSGLSLHNVLSGTVRAIARDAVSDHVIVQVQVGAVTLLAEVTQDAIARLRLAPGAAVHALIKSVSVELVASPRVAE